MEDNDQCHITWDEEHAVIATALVQELGSSESEASRIALKIQNRLNQLILDRLTVG